MATRHHARMAVVSLLYAYDLGNGAIADHTDEILEEKKIRNKQKDFALTLFDGVMAHLEEVDTAIVKHLKEWDFDRLGSIEPGKLADLAALDLHAPETQPLFNVVSQLIYAASGRQFTDVWVAGRRVLRDGELTTIDIGEVLTSAAHWRARLSASKEKSG